MEKRALGWDGYHREGGKLYYTQYETEPYKGFKKDESLGIDNRGRSTYYRKQHLKEGTEEYNRGIESLRSLDKARSEIYSERSRKRANREAYYRNAKALRSFALPAAGVATGVLGGAALARKFIKRASARVDDDYHTYDHYYKGKGGGINRTSVRPFAAKGYSEIGWDSDYWQPGAPKSSTGKAYQRLTKYKPGDAGYYKALAHVKQTQILPSDSVTGDIIGAKKKADTAKNIGIGAGVGAGALGGLLLAKRFIKKAQFEDNHEKIAGKLKQYVQRRREEKKQYDGGRAPRPVRAHSVVGTLFQLSRR